MDKIGSSVPVKNVTPGQVMFMVADHHANAGGDPIVKIDELPDDAEEAPLKAAQDRLEAIEKNMEKLDLVTNITDEVRDQRKSKLRRKQQVEMDEINRLQAIQALRTLSPAGERRRLINIFGHTRIAKFFPGQIPQLPQDFQEARQLGTQVEAPYERLLTVGGDR
jgi:ribonucleotide monophosphatase NagD (HAD superfamily)